MFLREIRTAEIAGELDVEDDEFRGSLVVCHGAVSGTVGLSYLGPTVHPASADATPRRESAPAMLRRLVEGAGLGALWLRIEHTSDCV